MTKPGNITITDLSGLISAINDFVTAGDPQRFAPWAAAQKLPADKDQLFRQISEEIHWRLAQELVK